MRITAGKYKNIRLNCPKGKPWVRPMTEKLKETELGLPEPRPRTQWELEYITDKLREFFS